VKDAVLEMTHPFQLAEYHPIVTNGSGGNTDPISTSFKNLVNNSNSMVIAIWKNRQHTIHPFKTKTPKLMRRSEILYHIWDMKGNLLKLQTCHKLFQNTGDEI